MAVNASQTINAPVEKVIETFTDEAFNRHVAERGGATLVSQNVEGDTSGPFKVTIVRSMGAEKLPDIAKKFVKGGLTVTQVDTWSGPRGNGSRDIQTEVSVGGMPVSGSGTQTLTAKGETTDVVVDVTVKANIPLVGGKVASAAEPYVGKALSLQSREADAWIASH